MQWVVWLSVIALGGLLLGACAAGPADVRPGPPAARRTPVKVACVGDSITEGAGTDPGPAYPGGPFRNAYPAQLARMLGPAYDVRNFGVGGTTLLAAGDSPYQRQAAFARAKAFQPDVVVLMLGTNDTKPQNWAHKDAFAADYRDLVRQFQDLPSHPRVYACRPCAVFGDGAFGINAPALAEELPILDAVAADLRLPVIDIFEATKNRPDVFPDRVHPNNAGAVILAETVYRAIMGTADAESRGARSRG
jgi:lysophospholipase L1-like esterase